MKENEVFYQFRDSLNNELPDSDLTPLLKSLWYAGKNDWQKAHQLVEQLKTAEGNWVHAYLHRREGDEWNANYWYRKANRPVPSIS